MTAPPLVLVHPGDLDTRTGGFGYDRRLVEALGALGRPVRTLALAGGYPEPSDADRLAARAIFAELPDGAIALVDMLAGGVLPEVFEAERKRLAIVALCHHPLALETGLDPAAAERLEALERRALAAARHVVVTSQATAETLVARFGVAAERITVALPGTDPRPEAHGDHRPPLLLTVATLTPRKGHDVLIAALADIADLPWVAPIRRRRPIRSRMGRATCPRGRRARPSGARSTSPAKWTTPRRTTLLRISSYCHRVTRDTAWSSPRRWRMVFRSSPPGRARFRTSFRRLPAGSFRRTIRRRSPTR